MTEIVHKIALHDLAGHVLLVNPDHIGTERPENDALGDTPGGKTVLEIDGIRHEVKESWEEIEKLIADLK